MSCGLPEAATAEFRQSSTKSGPQAGVVEVAVKVNRSPRACGDGVREGETFLFGGSLDKVPKLECMNKLA